MSDIEQHVATNVREFRERADMSQEELARRMSERGFGFSQATIWKIENGQRTVKISEAVVLSEIFNLLWMDLTRAPQVSRRQAAVAQAHRNAYQAFGALKEAAAEFLETQLSLSLAVREAQDDGLTVAEPLKSWLEIPAERAVLEARVEQEQGDKAINEVHEQVDMLLAALSEHGYKTPRPEDWISSAEFSEESAGPAG
ncbi:helix-turn-helix transcriptional regulator [Lentzea sp. NPDC006480]|uniref:helix-turn-helix domain-containing protein n=1 Tax=Lentzea sp. NPDC006480 TaxID=3157176 RepID=UPI0033B96AEE